MAKNTVNPEEKIAEETKAVETQKNTTAPANKEYQHFVYIGPSLPGGRLKSNTVLRGKIEEVKEYYKDVLEKFPQVARLIVPIEKLGESKEKVQTSGNVINKYYNDVVSAIVNNKEE